MGGGARIAWIAGAGAVGTLARYWVGGLVQRVGGTAFPWGTLAVNALGCLLFGCVWTLAEERLLVAAETRLVVLIGFMGAFTTFSTYAFETSQLLRDAEWALATANLLVENVLGVACFFLGVAVGRLI